MLNHARKNTSFRQSIITTESKHDSNETKTKTKRHDLWRRCRGKDTALFRSRCGSDRFSTIKTKEQAAENVKNQGRTSVILLACNLTADSINNATSRQ